MALRMLKDAVLNLVILAIIVALSLILLGPDQGLMNTVGSTSLEYNETNTALYAVADVADWYSLIILIIVFVGLIGMIYTLYAISKGRR